MGYWYKDGRKMVPQPDVVIITRGELQRRLKERIDKGDKAAAELWERWKYADRILDVFRDKPLYPPQDKNVNKDIVQDL